MTNQMIIKEDSCYRFEQGPIRPPSEAESLLLRVTRNCPWNQCTFCGLYKGEKFSIRPASEVLRDIESIKTAIESIKGETPAQIDLDPWVLGSAQNWLKNGMKSVFLQDANTLAVPPNDLTLILEAIRKNFPQVERITSYARSKTIAQLPDDDLKRLASAGLNRIHIGMESGSDKVLTMVKKGSDKETHIIAGKKVKKAGIELSEYIMPGLGGSKNDKEHALETASALNQINPDFIRIRTLALSDRSQLSSDAENGHFEKAGDVNVVEELLLLIENLEGITSTILSDHILNLLPEIEGVLPRDKDRIIKVIQDFLELDSDEQMVYIIGRRLGIMSGLYDLNSEARRRHALEFINANKVTHENVDAFADELMKRYI